MTTFGKITLQERVFTNKGKLVRPFITSAKVHCRSYSTVLQRVMTDFGAETSFASASAKIKEHYGIEIPISSVGSITANHASIMRKSIDSMNVSNKAFSSAEHIIAETDGSMVPIVLINRDVDGDKRKTRKTEWCEARLALAREKGSHTSIYSALIGSVDEAGKQLSYVVKSIGRNDNTKIHGVGDGALWIADQFDKQFGIDGSFLIDFFHLSDYLHKASLCCDPTNSTKWLYAMQALMKENKTDIVLKKIEEHIYDQKQTEHACGATKCHQYIVRRAGQFNYKNALDKGLPIGSGEIESGHRSVIQKRLKIPGAWWLKWNANNMLALRTTRANGDWNKYWSTSSLGEIVN